MFRARPLKPRDLVLLEQQIKIAEQGGEFPEAIEDEALTLLHKLCALECDGDTLRRKEELIRTLVVLAKKQHGEDATKRYLNTKRPKPRPAPRRRRSRSRSASISLSEASLSSGSSGSSKLGRRKRRKSVGGTPDLFCSGTALHDAVSTESSLGLVELLVENGADPTLKAQSLKGIWEGPSPFLLAIKKRLDKIAVKMAKLVDDDEDGPEGQPSTMMRLVLDREFTKRSRDFAFQHAYRQECSETFDWILTNMQPLVQDKHDRALIEKLLRVHAVRAFGVNTLIPTLCPTFHLLMPYVGNIRAIPVYIIDYAGWFDLELHRGAINDLYCHHLNPAVYPNCLWDDPEALSRPPVKRAVSRDSQGESEEDSKDSTDDEPMPDARTPPQGGTPQQAVQAATSAEGQGTGEENEEPSLELTGHAAVCKAAEMQEAISEFFGSFNAWMMMRGYESTSSSSVTSSSGSRPRAPSNGVRGLGG